MPRNPFHETPTEELLRHAEALASSDSLDGDAESTLGSMVLELWHKRGTESVFARASSWCAHSNASLRKLGADTFRELGLTPEQQRSFARRSVPKLLALLQDEDACVVTQAVTSLMNLHEHHAWDPRALEGLEKHPSTDLRLGLTLALSRVGRQPSDFAVTTLIQMTRDRDREVRGCATLFLDLSDLDSDTVRDAFRDRRSDVYEEIRETALEALARRSEPKS